MTDRKTELCSQCFQILYNYLLQPWAEERNDECLVPDDIIWNFISGRLIQ